MGFLRFLWRLFFSGGDSSKQGGRPKRRRKQRATLSPTRYRPRLTGPQYTTGQVVEQSPYPFARFYTGGEPGTRSSDVRYLDMTADRSTLPAERGLPLFHTPEELADWLDMPVGRLAWLIHRGCYHDRPENERAAHYHFHWTQKRTGGWRLIEAPKPILKAVQAKIQTEILVKIPAHETAHGFVTGRSIVTNARPHVGQKILVKYDLENFYASVGFSRVVAIFRRIGYCREASLWLARLTTSALPPNISFAGGDPHSLEPYLKRHLPQGAPTSPALANLSALGMDVRLQGLANSYRANYTRYADDITFSGDESLRRSLRSFLPLTTKIIREERFTVNMKKRKVIRRHQRQTVTGVIVNDKLNSSRHEFDHLKAILTNCLRNGPESQNRDQHPDFAAHLRGRIAHISQLNRNRGMKLLNLFNEIAW
ncbi:MAG: retron St85 family RNA-directed DNA polymerase [Planctomycetaceae bacterium]